jgi:hypothetical protein
MRILLFTGKGGVGKTTVAAATAVRAARAGLRTVVVSTDPAHSLADAFDVALGDQPTEVAPRLWGQQLNARVRFEETWDDVRRYMVDVLDWMGADSLEAEELAVVPGLDEVFSLADIKQFATSGDYDLVVVDCADGRDDSPFHARRARLVHGSVSTPAPPDADGGRCPPILRSSDSGRSGVRRYPLFTRVWLACASCSPTRRRRACGSS